MTGNENTLSPKTESEKTESEKTGSEKTGSGKTESEKAQSEKTELKRQGLKRQGLKSQGLKRQGLKRQGLKRQGLKSQGLKRQSLKRQGLKRFEKFWTQALLFRIFLSFSKGNSEHKPFCSEFFFSFSKGNSEHKPFCSEFFFSFSKGNSEQKPFCSEFSFSFSKGNSEHKPFCWEKTSICKDRNSEQDIVSWKDIVWKDISEKIRKRHMSEKSPWQDLEIFWHLTNNAQSSVPLEFDAKLEKTTGDFLHVAKILPCKQKQKQKQTKWKWIRLDEYDFSFKTWKVTGLDLSLKKTTKVSASWQLSKHNALVPSSRHLILPAEKNKMCYTLLELVSSQSMQSLIFLKT